MTASAHKLRDDELLIDREFDAPLALVWRLWESRDHMIRWWGPEQFTCVELDWELTPGRPWRAMMASKSFNRKVSRMRGTIKEVVKNKRIVFTFRWENESGYDMDTLITVSFAEKDGMTVQSFHQTPFTTVEIRDSHVGGWTSLINKQQLYAENVATAEGSHT
jgi:uncharacterized protein YndB with AHSA1/START domain